MARRTDGLFVTLEGGEGAGKSTQAPLLAQALREEGHEVVATREPGGTPGAEAIREMLLFGKAELSWRAEILAHVAARRDHLDGLILPALARGAIVICDRFHDSTVAYQGYGAGGGDSGEGYSGNAGRLDFIRKASALIDRWPDITFLFALPREAALERLRLRHGKADRYEAKGEDFHARVRDGFERIAASAPERVRRIDASRPPEEVTRALLTVIRERL